MTHRNIRLFTWFNFLMALRFYGPIAILYYTQVSGSYALGMSIFALATLAQAIFEVPTGLFSDLIGRKQTLVCGALVSLLSVIAYAVGGVYAMLALGAGLEGLARAFFSGNNDALLYDTLAGYGAEATYMDALGKTSAMLHIGFGSAAVIGSLLAAISFQSVMWLSVLPIAMAALLSFFFQEATKKQVVNHSPYAHLRIAVAKTLGNRRLRALSLASIMANAIGESAWLFRSAFLKMVWPIWALGGAQLLADAGTALGYYFAGPVIRRFGELRLLVGGAALSELCNFLALLFPTAGSPILMSLNSGFYGVNGVAMSGLMQREFTDEQRATMGSLTGFACSILFALVSVLFGALADRIGVIPALLTAPVLSIIPMLITWQALVIPSTKKEQRE